MTSAKSRWALARSAFTCAALTLLTPRLAWSGCEQQDQQAETEAFRQGLAKFRDNDAQGAVEIWQRLLKTLGAECGWKVLFNLGRGYEKLGDPTRAIENYSAFISAANKQTMLADKETTILRSAEESISVLKAKYGAIHVPAAGTGVVWVRVGLSEPQPAGFTVYVAPGSHEIELFARTSRATKQSVQTVAGQVLTIQIPATDASAVAAKPTADDARSAPQAGTRPREFPTVLVAIGAGLTLASVGANVFLYTRQASKRDDAEAFARSDPKYATLRDEHQDARTLYQVSLGVTGVFAAATTAIVLVHVLGGEDSPAVQASAAPGVARLGFSGRF